MRHTVFLALFVLACGDAASAPSTAADASLADAAAGFVLSSPVVAAGAMLPDAYTCRGANVSPPLAWTAGPSATAGYALVFTDLDNGLVHSVMWDIPGSARALPEHVENAAMPAVPAGAKQARGYDEQTFGYLGPCPGDQVHTYELELRAVDVASMPGLTPDSSREQVVSALAAHTLATAKLAVKSD